ncbi:MAG: amidohydrolase family protein [Chloroflexi bacterium]|nr:amidohydrolase family protein [Chloroflexota bacterium]
MSRAAQIHDQLGHPVLDCDGHWQESPLVLTEYLREVAGPSVTDEFLARRRREDTWASATLDERAARRLRRNVQWGSPAETVDKATAMLPALFQERLGELGIDFAIVYPSMGLPFTNLGREDVRRGVIRAYNVMAADTFADYQRSFAPAACIPLGSPQEALDELEYAVGTLGMKVIMVRGATPRPLPATGAVFERSFETSSREVPFYVDSIGLDSPYDWDPFWRRCGELKVAVTSHGGAHEWSDRKSINNFVFNHVGHFAQANAVFTKGVFLGGVTHRFPELNFGFLEGGAGYAVNLLLDIIGHWEKLNPSAIREHLSPANTDTSQLKQLMERCAYPRLRDKIDQIVSGLDGVDVNIPIYDDFEHVDVHTSEDIVELYTRNFYFGCEADDPVTAWAFDPRMRAPVKAVFSSDISHWDVPVMANVLPEAYELVEHGLLGEADFRAFTWSNALHLHGDMNPEFFVGTTLEQAAAAELAQPVA